MFGILALQGGFGLHQKALERFGLQSQLIKRPEELVQIHVLIIPGGESTALLKLMKPLNWKEAIVAFAQQGKLILATCAGLIILSRPTPVAKDYLGLIDIEVKRNAYGRQINSFVGLGTSLLGISPLKIVCIRAPEVTFVGQDVAVLVSLAGRPMLLRQNNIVVTTFHPELSPNYSFYHWLTRLISNVDLRMG
ncbi:pyridoxal 5'-phosphate synthase glutaminase subunit PdxT [Candidatus Cardinium hertigii]|uniref:pyridoxal 5'-phosphate synthase glutaminase subunit PdxT n=1 Tax=Candidatus Cardinium hertigii TaxID=247481 RepID=UPI003D7C37F8